MDQTQVHILESSEPNENIVMQTTTSKNFPPGLSGRKLHKWPRGCRKNDKRKRKKMHTPKYIYIF